VAPSRSGGAVGAPFAILALLLLAGCAAPEMGGVKAQPGLQAVAAILDHLPTDLATTGVSVAPAVSQAIAADISSVHTMAAQIVAIKNPTFQLGAVQKTLDSLDRLIAPYNAPAAEADIVQANVEMRKIGA
jgi:hypothetical protein